MKQEIYARAGLQEFSYYLTVDKKMTEINEPIYKMIFNKLKEVNPSIDFMDVLIKTKPRYPKEILNEIGYAVAAGWGGECLKAETFPKTVRFDCIEHGEKFQAYITYEEIENDYAYILNGKK